MKKGKELKIDNFKNYNVVYGGVNNKNPKAIYIKISAWAELLQDDDINYTRVIKDINKKIRQLLYLELSQDVTNPFWEDRSIIDFDIKKSGISFGKRSYVNCELTLFVKNLMPVNSEYFKSIIDHLIERIISSVLDESKFFKFHRKKN